MDDQNFVNSPMEQYFNESGNDTMPAAMLGPAAYVVPLLLMAMFVTLPSTLLNVLTMITLVRDSAINKPARIILSSLSANALLFEVGVSIWVIGHILRALRWVEDSPESYSCRVPLYLVFIGLYIRFLLNALFAVVMYRIIKRGIRAVSIPVVVIAILVMSAVVLVSNIPMFTPSLYVSSEFVDGVGCNMQPVRPGGLIHLFGLWFIVSLSGTTIVVVFAAVSYRFVKRHIAAESDTTGCRRAMLRFSLSLIVTNVLNMVAAFIPILAIGTQGETTIESVQLRVAVKLMFYIVMDASVLPQPILMMVLFKPLQKSVKDMWRAVMTCMRKAQVQQTQQGKVEGATSVAPMCVDVSA